MKKKMLYVSVTLSLLLFLLLCPAEAADAAADGLLVWYRALLPTLLPFFVLSSLLIALDGVATLTRILYPALHALFGCSREGSFCLATGFLCGLPTGARIAGELTRARHITREEGDYLLGFCSNVSPAFLIGFCLTETLKRPDLLLPAVLLVFGCPVLVGLFTRRGRHFATLPAEKKTSGSQISFKIVDACIMGALESILKLGCYILLFSLLARLLGMLPSPSPLLSCMLAGLLEVTGGVARIGAESTLAPGTAFVLTVGFLSFGGLCGLAQVQSMIEGSGLSITRYLKIKLLTAGLAAAAAALFVRLSGAFV